MAYACVGDAIVIVDPDWGRRYSVLGGVITPCLPPTTALLSGYDHDAYAVGNFVQLRVLVFAFEADGVEAQVENVL